MSKSSQRILEYPTRRPSVRIGALLLRLFLIGPCTGALVGFAQNSALLLCWLFHGQPDFFYRGWSGVRLEFLSLTLSGATIGVPYGFGLWAFERLTCRKIRVNSAISLTVVLAFLEAALFAQWEFRHSAIKFEFLPHCTAVVTGWVLSMVASRKTHSDWRPKKSAAVGRLSIA
jgi:hypothetical protein